MTLDAVGEGPVNIAIQPALISLPCAREAAHGVEAACLVLAALAAPPQRLPDPPLKGIIKGSSLSGGSRLTARGGDPACHISAHCRNVRQA